MKKRALCFEKDSATCGKQGTGNGEMFDEKKKREQVKSPWRKLHGFYRMFPVERQILQQLVVLLVCHGLAAGQIPSRYFLIQSPVPWVKAREFCQNHYVDFAVLATEEEYLTLLNAIPAIKASFWLGLQRQSIGGGWTWVSGEELDYRRWFRINNQGLCVSLEATLKKEEKLLARYCDEPHMILCQGPVSPRSVSVASVGSSGLSISWNISAFMRMTAHSYNVTVCHSVCETYFYSYSYGSSFMSVYVPSLASSTEYFVQVSAYVVRPDMVTGRQAILQDGPATLQVKTMDPEPQSILFICLKSLVLMSLAPPLWILYWILKKELFTETSRDQSSAELSAQDTVIDLLPEEKQDLVKSAVGKSLERSVMCFST